ncbi:MAG: beta-ketoacyl-[acyl-carrier-protein] synthase II, partial [Comamonas sp.]
ARDGFVMGEGAGMLVLESLEHALARGATPLAEVLGYGTSADAYHITAGPESGEGALRAMQAALAQAQLQPAQIQHLNAHATSTPVGDKGELAAIRSLFGDAIAAGHGPAITATKSAIGHLLGAAGGVASVFTVLALRDQIVPPLLNLAQPDALAEGLDLVRGSARPVAMRHALLNGFGFGGVNASLVLGRYQG